jgi:hypothetical protein
MVWSCPFKARFNAYFRDPIKDHFRTLNANACFLMMKHSFAWCKAAKENGVSASYCADAMEAKITF